MTFSFSNQKEIQRFLVEFRAQLARLEDFAQHNPALLKTISEGDNAMVQEVAQKVSHSTFPAGFLVFGC